MNVKRTVDKPSSDASIKADKRGEDVTRDSGEETFRADLALIIPEGLVLNALLSL
jgi:hypothetical protein